MTGGGGPAGRRILANLDGEADLAVEASRASGRHKPRLALPRAALEVAAGAGTLLRVFAGAGDRLHTPLPVAPERLPELPGIPRPALESGPLRRLDPTAELLAWCETRPAASLRRGAGRPASGPPPDLPLHQLPWRLPAADPAVVAAVHHRGFALATAEELGCALPGARLVASPAELAAHLAAGGADAAPGGRWVLKAPLSAAGRGRHLAAGPALPDGADRRRIERLFVHHGPLLFEPWMERLADFGATAFLAPGDPRRIGWHPRRIGWHRLRVDPGGRFRGIELRLDGPPPGLDDADLGLLDRTLDGVARALAARGYAGPFGVDVWRYRRADGTAAWNPLGEVNARLTFGWVARAFAERLRGPLGLSASALLRLRLGRRPPTSGALPLLLPGKGGHLAAWLEVDG